MDRIRYDLIRVDGAPGRNTVNIDVMAFLVGDHRSAMEEVTRHRELSALRNRLIEHQRAQFTSACVFVARKL